MKIKTETIIRTVVLAFALINQSMTSLGYPIISLDNEMLQEFLSLVITIGAAVWAWWKNNSFTKNAVEADEVLSILRSDENELIDGEGEGE